MPTNPTHDTTDELVAAVRQVVAEALAAGQPQLLDQPTAIAYSGLSRGAWFRLKSAGKLPAAVYVDGAGERWRRRDLDAWIGRMKPARRWGHD